MDVPPIKSSAVSDRCSPDQIGRTIEPAHVCAAVLALKNWMDKSPIAPPDMQPGDWSRVRALEVCDMPIPGREGEPPKAQLVIYADVPERPRLFFVEWRIETTTPRFGANHRGPL